MTDVGDLDPSQARSTYTGIVVVASHESDEDLGEDLMGQPTDGDESIERHLERDGLLSMHSDLVQYSCLRSRHDSRIEEKTTVELHGN